MHVDRYKELFSEEHKGRVANWEEAGLPAIKADLEHNNGINTVGGNSNVKRLAWLWVEHKELQETQAANPKWYMNPWLLVLVGAVVGAIATRIAEILL